MKFFLVLAILFASLHICFAQEKPKAELYDEVVNMPCDELKGRIHGFFVQLGNNSNSTGRIIIYGEQNNQLRNYQYKSLIKDIIVNMGNYDVSRVTFVHARSEKKLRVQFWLGPPEAEKVRYDEENWDYVLTAANKPFIFDYNDDYPESDCPTKFDSAFYAKLLQTNPNLRGHIVIRQRSVAGFNKIRKELSKKLIQINKTPLDKIKFFYAKPDRYTAVEYWLVPLKKK
jgi:outer membrane protein assembly factor BamE (lipoprotein component of BamABCDE complex)